MSRSRLVIIRRALEPLSAAAVAPASSRSAPVPTAAPLHASSARAAPLFRRLIATTTSPSFSSPLSCTRRGLLGCTTTATAAAAHHESRWSSSYSSSSRRGIAASAHVASAADDKKDGEEETTHSFQAETRRLLDIVTNSLYTDKEVFVRELVSNASDALEKCRHDYLARGEDPGDLTVTITTDDAKRQFIIQDTGLGMNREDLVANLGTIARSGSKAFVEELNAEAEAGVAASGAGAGAGAASSSGANIIGKFGVGFYSAFMVSDRVDVYSSTGDGAGWKWSSAGDGSYTLAPCEVMGEGEVGVRSRYMYHIFRLHVLHSRLKTVRSYTYTRTHCTTHARVGCLYRR